MYYSGSATERQQLLATLFKSGNFLNLGGLLVYLIIQNTVKINKKESCSNFEIRFNLEQYLKLAAGCLVKMIR